MRMRTLGNVHTSIQCHLAIFVMALWGTVGTAWADCEENEAGFTNLAYGSVYQSVDSTATFRVELPSTGVLTLELSRSGRIDALSDPCFETGADVLVAERSDRHLVLAARTAGAVVLRVATQAPRFRVASDFTAARVVVDHADLGGLPVRRTSFFKTFAAKVEPEDVDPDPGGLRSDTRPLASFLTIEASYIQKVEPEDVDPDPGG
jgi:hypothetical protein